MGGSTISVGLSLSRAELATATLKKSQKKNVLCDSIMLAPSIYRCVITAIQTLYFKAYSILVKGLIEVITELIMIMSDDNDDLLGSIWSSSLRQTVCHTVKLKTSRKVDL